MRLRIRCPNCQQLLMVREEEAGKPGRCPMCKQQVMLPRPKKSANLAAVAAQPAGQTSARPARAADEGLPLALAPEEQTAPSTAPSQPDADDAIPLAVERLDDDAARQQMSLRGAIPVPVSGPPPSGRPRSPGLAFLTALVPFYGIYWYILARSEIFAHLEQPARTAGQIALRVGLLVVTGGLFGWFYCSYVVPRRIAEMQSGCGDPHRVSAAWCLILGLVPVFGWALNVFTMQKALTRHWQWHGQREADSVTAGLAG